MKLTTNWRNIIKHSWLVRIAALGTTFNVLQQFFYSAQGYVSQDLANAINLTLGVLVLACSVINDEVLHGTSDKT
jgi:uncharacterized membrane protein